MKKILLSLGMIVFVGALVAGATGAFFSDTETSTGNTFTAGALDLKVDSEAHYNGMVCRQTTEEDLEDDFGTGEVLDAYEWHAGFGFPNGDGTVPADHYPQPGMDCEGTWAETDLGIEQQFFNLTDIKPGDEGENTISLHVYNNDAWGRFVVDNVQDLDNTCTEPENEAMFGTTTDADPQCNNATSTPGVGELAQSITFDAWVDWGTIPGFQCNNPENQVTEGARCEADVMEGDNIWNGGTSVPTEPRFWTGETVDDVAEGPFELADVFAPLFAQFCSTENATGSNGYGLCHGIAQDGRMVGSTTYYFGLGWSVPTTVGNEAQTDSLNADLTFEVEQHRNNTDPFEEN